MTGEGDSEVGVGMPVAVGDSGWPSSLLRWNRGEPMNVFIVWENFRFHGDPGCPGNPPSWRNNKPLTTNICIMMVVLTGRVREGGVSPGAKLVLRALEAEGGVKEVL